MQKTIRIILSLLFISGLISCQGIESDPSFSGGSIKAGGSDTSNNAIKNNPNIDESLDEVVPVDTIASVEKEKEAINNLPDKPIVTDKGVINAKKCSNDIDVHGKGNLYLAGMPDGTSIDYNVSTDYAPSESPVLLVPDVESCLKVGSKLYFDIAGTISHGGSAATDADGKISYISDHQKKDWLGKSNITAPLNAMLGLFLGDGDPSLQVAPAALSFATADERNYTVISPLVGQIFFIGDGKDANGNYQKVIVPAGAKRLYLGIMDAYEWNNNSGQLMGSLLIEE